MDAIGKAGLDIVQIVAEIDDAILGSRFGNGAGKDIALGAAAIGAKSVACDRSHRPQALQGAACAASRRLAVAMPSEERRRASAAAGRGRRVSRGPTSRSGVQVLARWSR